MDQKSLGRWLRVMIAGLAVCGLLLYLWAAPQLGRMAVHEVEGFSADYFWPWLIFVWVSGLPCYAVLVCGWLVTLNISADRSFSLKNGRLLKAVSLLAAADSAYFFIGNAVLLFLGMSHPGVAVLAVLVVFIGVAVAVAGAAASHLVMKAAALQEQSDLTI